MSIWKEVMRGELYHISINQAVSFEMPAGMVHSRQIYGRFPHSYAIHCGYANVKPDKNTTWMVY